MKLAVVVPCLNEGRSVAGVLDAVPREVRASTR